MTFTKFISKRDEDNTNTIDPGFASAHVRNQLTTVYLPPYALTSRRRLNKTFAIVSQINFDRSCVHAHSHV